MHDFSETEFANAAKREEFWDSNGGEFVRLNGKARILRAIERFARVVLLENPDESVFPTCETCQGSKLEETVYDSVHIDFGGGGPRGAGTGETRARTVQYCPTCDQKPQGGIIREKF